MDSETPVLKWTAAAIGVIVLCFCLGYFVLGRGPSGSEGGNAVVVATPLDGANASPVPVVSASAAATGPALVVDERTDAIEAKQKAEEAAKKKAEAEAKRKEEADGTLKAQEDAAAAAAANNATPAPTDNGNTLGATGTTGDDIATPSPTPAVVDAGNDTTAPATGTKTARDIAPASTDTLYRVRVGSYPSRDAAKTMATELVGRGYAAMVVNGGGGTYRLQVGAYKDKKTADGIQQELKANGYDATVSN